MLPSGTLGAASNSGLGREKVGFGIWCLSLLVGLGAAGLASAAPLSDPAVDSYNMRVGTETFSGLYKFTTNTLLVETAQGDHQPGERHHQVLHGAQHLQAKRGDAHV